jgi:hypothetical protein
VTVDFVEAELIPAEVGSSSGDAVFTGGDLQQFIDWNGGKTIYLPKGIYYIDRELYFGVDGTTLKGAGSWHTQIHFTQRSSLDGGLRANAYDVSFQGLYLTTDQNSRSNSYKGLNGVFTGGSHIEDIWAEHFEAGAWIAQYNSGPSRADGFTLTKCRFRNNYADGINLTRGSRNATISHSNFRSNGDDAMAIWSNSGSMECQNNLFEYNTAELNWRSAGCALYGGYNNQFRHIVVKDQNEVGIKVNNAFNGSIYNSDGQHIFDDIEIHRCGTQRDLFDGRVAALDIACSDVGGTRVNNVKFSNMAIYDSKNDAVHIKKWGGEGFYNLVFENITIDGTGLEYPSNSTGDIRSRGYGILFQGEPSGYGTYCNLQFFNRGGNAPEWESKGDIGSFSWTTASGCSNASAEVTSPSNGDAFGLCDGDITIEANATSTGGSIEKVVFYLDGEQVGEDFSSPYSYDLENPGAGNYSISASVVSAGVESFSIPIEVSVAGAVREFENAPIIDGIMDFGWFDKVNYSLNKQMWGGNGISGSSDLSAYFKIGMDQDNLYVFVDVTDDALYADSETNENWKDDKVEIYVDFGNDKLNEYGDDDHFYGFVHDDETFYFGPGSATGATFAEGSKNNGYMIEVSIPWSTIGGIPEFGDFIGIEVMVNDDDNGGDRESKIAWTDDSDNSWNNPSLFGELQVLSNIHETEYVCSGESFEFPDGTVVQNVTEPMEHSSEVSSGSGCDNVIVTHLEVYHYDMKLSAVGQYLESNVSGADSYQWLDCQNDKSPLGGETSPTFVLSDPGSFALQVETNGCVNISDCYDHLMVATAVNEVKGFEFYPNPVSDNLVISGEFEGVEYRVLSISGQEVSSGNLDARQVVDFTGLGAGGYLIHLITEQGAMVRFVTKQ